jgi:hypothetical protein
VEQEARTFVNRIQSGEIAALSNDDAVKTFKALNPEVIASYLEISAQPYNEYELWMRREERLGGHWPAKPFLNYINSWCSGFAAMPFKMAAVNCASLAPSRIIRPSGTWSF